MCLEPVEQGARVDGSVRARALPTLVALASVTVAVAALALLLGAGAGARHPSWGTVTTAMATASLGLLVLWHRPGHRIGGLLLTAGALFSVTALAAGVLERGSGDFPAVAEQFAFAWVWLASAPLVLVWMLLILGLPEGDVGTGWRRKLVVLSVPTLALLAVGRYLLAPAGTAPAFPPAKVHDRLGGPLADLVDVPQVVEVSTLPFAALPVVALLGLVGRYRSADPLTRQQLKWVALAVAGAVLLNLVDAALHATAQESSEVTLGLRVVAEVLPTAGIALAALRYRLWSLDLLVARSVAYAVLWLLLSVALIALGAATGSLAGGRDALLPVLLALLVTVAAQPARVWLERQARRRIYGERPSGYAVVVEFAAALATADNVDELAERVAAEVRRALGARWTGVWLATRTTSSLRFRAVTDGAVTPAPVILPAEAVRALESLDSAVLVATAPPGVRDVLQRLGPEPAAVCATVRTGGQLMAVLTCSQPETRRLADADLELLDLLAAEAALAMRNCRLEIELRDRLAQIERQAEDVRESRHRLVTAQDTERRRIERDLHDGVQQQLVSLTARLRRSARCVPAAASALQDLAAEAEDVMFALQDLARGIYPSILVDSGLVEALHVQAGRVAADVRIEVEPALAGRRLLAECEAACYFVALEAMTNAQKHAPGAAVTISLRSAEDSPGFVLEVHDDGPGFSLETISGGTRGIGLQNMADRIAAVGGELVVDSRPGAGTWLRAHVPLSGEVLALPAVRQPRVGR